MLPPSVIKTDSYLFKYSAPKIIKCWVVESPQKMILSQNIRPFVASESGNRYSAKIILGKRIDFKYTSFFRNKLINAPR